MPSLENISLLTLVNNQDIYQKNVLESTKGESHVIEYVWISWAKDAASALNWGLNRCKHNTVVCCHQDVEFLPGWYHKLIELKNVIGSWGVLGMAGTTFGGKMVGTHSGLGMDGNKILRAMTLDCSTIILNKRNGLKFDEKLKYFHCYGEDIALQANNKGLGAFVIIYFMKFIPMNPSPPVIKTIITFLQPLEK